MLEWDTDSELFGLLVRLVSGAVSIKGHCWLYSAFTALVCPMYRASKQYNKYQWGAERFITMQQISNLGIQFSNFVSNNANVDHWNQLLLHFTSFVVS